MHHQGVGATSRFAHNVHTLGILWLVLSVLRLVPGLTIVIIFHLNLFPQLLSPLTHRVLTGIGLFFLIGGILGIVIGGGLLRRRPWARMLAMVIGVIGLVEIPIGTAVGIYSLWLLLPAESERQYVAISKAT